MPLPRPQDQLKSYFDDLLFDEDEPEKELPASPLSTDKSQLATKTELAPRADLPAKPEAKPEAKPQLKDEYLVVKTQPQVSEQEAIYQLQRQRLQSLLNSLTATEDSAPTTEQSTQDTLTTDSLLTQPADLTTPFDLTQQALAPVESIALAVDDQPLSSHWLDNGRPHWAQDPFDILLLEIQGINLAVPLAALGHIHKINHDNISLFGQADWLLGLQKTIMGNVKAVNTARFIMPERYNDSMAQHYQYTVVINGLKWGLAVDRVNQPLTIDPDNIRWRARRSERPWIAGTVKEHMCVLLDIPVFGEVLCAEDRNG